MSKIWLLGLFRAASIPHRNRNRPVECTLNSQKTRGPLELSVRVPFLRVSFSGPQFAACRIVVVEERLREMLP